MVDRVMSTSGPHIMSTYARTMHRIGAVSQLHGSVYAYHLCNVMPFLVLIYLLELRTDLWTLTG